MSRVLSRETVGKQPGIIVFHQVNVGKGGTNMDIALQQAWDAGADIVMVQEPWTMLRDGNFITKSHQGYNSHIPTSTLR